MAEIDVQSELQAVTKKMEALTEDLNKVNAQREQLIAQVLKNQGKIEVLSETVEDSDGNVQEEVPDVIKWKENKLKPITEQMEVLVPEVNKVTLYREQVIGQIQHLQGASMYLRGKTEDSNDVQVEGGENLPPEVVEQAKEAVEGKINKGDKDSQEI